jgi:hypothetical protein
MSLSFSSFNVVSPPNTNSISKIDDEFWNLLKRVETKLLEVNSFNTEDPSCYLCQIQLDSISQLFHHFIDNHMDILD